MKKLLLSVLAIGMLACTPEDEQTTTPDCDCDRVVEVHTFNVIGTPENPAINYHSRYTTINDCSGIQREKTHNTTFQNQIPQIGQCR